MGSLSLSKVRHPNALRIAVSGHAASQAQAFVRAAREQGHELRICSSLYALVQMMLRDEFDLAVSYLEDGPQVGALVRWFAGRRPSTELVLAITTQDGEALEDLKTLNPKLSVWRGLSVEDQVQSLQALSPRSGVVGRFLEIDLVDYIQITQLNAASKLIRVSSYEGSGYIWFDRGRIVHAEYGDRDSQEAFYALVSGVAGSFCEVAFQAPAKQSISASNTHLLMEASRLKDEAKLPAFSGTRHPLDTNHFDPLYGLEMGQDVQLVQLDVDSEAQEPANDTLTDNELDAFFDASFDLPDQRSQDFVSHCQRVPGVLAAVSVLFDEQLPLSGPHDELLDWVEAILPVFRCREAMPSNTVVAREGQTHFIAVVLDFHLVAIQIDADCEPYSMRDELVAKASQL